MGNSPGPPFRIIFLLVCAALLFPAALSAQRGALTRPENLDQLVGRASLIVHGRVLSARVEPHPQYANLSTVVVTLRVDETLKGAPAPTLTFRQFIWDLRDRLDAAGYRKGLELVLLLNPETRLGLRSPTGLEQGRFRILRDPAGRSEALNGRGNAGLFTALAPQLDAKGVRLSARLQAAIQQPGPRALALDDLRDLIRVLAAER
jgi:hypothetical protein